MNEFKVELSENNSPSLPSLSVDQRLARLETSVQNLHDKFDMLLANVDSVIEQVKPAIESLSNSPLVKMITGGGK